MSAIQQALSSYGAEAGTGYRYWRVFITANNGDANSTNIAELELRGTVGGAKLTPTITGVDSRVLVSSETSGSLGYRAFDGNLGSVPWITAAGQALNSYIGWDFGTPTDILQYGISLNTASPAGRAPKDFRLEASSNNSTWTTIHTATDQTTVAVWSPASGALVLYNV